MKSAENRKLEVITCAATFILAMLFGGPLMTSEAGAQPAPFEYSNLIDKAFDFSLVLPEGAEVSAYDDIVPDPGTPVRELLFARVENHFGVIVRAAYLPREINPSDWLLGWLAKEEYRLIEFETLDSEYGRNGKALAQRNILDESDVHNMATIRDGNRLFLIEAFFDTENPEDIIEMREIFQQALMSFRLANPDKFKFAEKLAHHRSGHAIAVYLPESWKSDDPVMSDDGVMISKSENRLGDDLSGVIIVFTAEGGIGDPRIDRYQAEIIDKSGVILGREVETRKSVSGQGVNILTTVYETGRINAPIEIRIAEAADSRTVARLILLTARRDDSFQDWAVNTRAMEIATDLMDFGVKAE